jgi:hypothetical protein
MLHAESMGSPAGLLVVALAAFRILGLGHAIPSEIDRGPCPQGRWSQALYAAHAPRRIGTMYGCGRTISKGADSRLDPAWIHQTAREQFVLPGGSIFALCDERFQWRDAEHSRATFRCRVEGGGTIAGAGNAVHGRANYLLRFTHS